MMQGKVGDTYKGTLSFPLSDMKSILKFSDRPARIIKYITPTQLQENWIVEQSI